MTYIRVTGLVFLVVGLLGCAVNGKSSRPVSEPDSYCDLAGYSIKPPSGSDWNKLPTKDNFPNLIEFVKGKGLVARGAIDRWAYLKATTVMATGTILDEPIKNRNDKNLLAVKLKEHLQRYQFLWPTKIVSSNYDSSLGMDCLKYSAKLKKTRVNAENADAQAGESKGYFCLHPGQDSFGVIMEAQNMGSVNTILARLDEQADHFFTSLRFNPVSSPVSRTFRATSYHVGKTPYQMIFYRGKLWAVLRDENRTVQIDPVGGKIVASVAVGSRPVAITSYKQGVWVANSEDGTVMRIDPLTASIVKTIQVGGKPVSISSGHGYVWVANASENTVVRINPATNTVAATIAVGREPRAVVAAADGIWTANAGDGTVSLIDKAHDWVIDTIRIGGRPVHISLANTGAWVADDAGKEVVRIDRKSRTAIARIGVGGNPSWISAYEDWDLFVALSDPAQIVRIDPAGNRVFGAPFGTDASPRSMIYFGGSIWFVNSAGTTLTKVYLSPMGQALNNSSFQPQRDEDATLSD